MLTSLQTVRRHLGYTAAQVIDLLTRRAHALNLPIATRVSLKTKLSRWENGKEQPSEIYRRLFREIYGRTNAELGFPEEPEEDPEAAELRSRLAMARTVDPEAVDVFRHQVDQARFVDRRFGALTQLDQLCSQIHQVQQLLTYRAGPQRHALAEVLVEASTLAGWQALDRAALGQAWTHYERAKAAAREANSPALLAHATAEQAFVLNDLDETTAAIDQLAYARSIANGTATPLLRAWLAAAHGETLGAAGHADDARRAFDMLPVCCPPTPSIPRCPSCSSATLTLIAGGATPWHASAHPTRSTNSPPPSLGCQLTLSGPVPAYLSTWPTLTPPLVTAMQRSATPASPAASRRRSNPTGSNDGSTNSCYPVAAAPPREAR